MMMMMLTDELILLRPPTRLCFAYARPSMSLIVCTRKVFKMIFMEPRRTVDHCEKKHQILGLMLLKMAE